MANEAIKILTGIGQTLLGRVMLLEAATFQWTMLRLEASPQAQPRQHLEADYQVFCGLLPEDQAAFSHQTIETLSAEQLNQVLHSEEPPLLLDVRDPHEIELGQLPDAMSIPLGGLAQRANDLEPEDDIVIYCQSGVRSEQAVRQLRELGFEQLSHLDEGLEGWSAAQLPVRPSKRANLSYDALSSTSVLYGKRKVDKGIVKRAKKFVMRMTVAVPLASP